jgi:hypothetical protein
VCVGGWGGRGGGVGARLCGYLSDLDITGWMVNEWGGGGYGSIGT